MDKVIHITYFKCDLGNHNNNKWGHILYSPFSLQIPDEK